MYASKETFKDIQISLDGGSFYACHFERCKLVYTGILPVVMDGCSIVDCRWQFDGPALNTLGFLQGLHTMGGDGMALARSLVNSIVAAPASRGSATARSN
jgi:hypothetical protein